MKKEPLLLLFTLFAMLLSAQNHRFLYEYTFRMDSLDRSKSEKETMVLDIGKEGSRYYSYEKAVHDSVMAAEREKLIASKSTHLDFRHIIDRSRVRTRITKQYPDFSTTMHTTIAGDDLQVQTTTKMQWMMSSETKTIEGFKAQKATTQFGGRHWTAWYTGEIPFQDGPYKFSGLPGLILEVEDDKKDHVFKFAGSRKNTAPATEVLKKGIPVSEKKFKELWKAYLNDPAKRMRLLMSDPEVTITMRDATGRIIPHAEMIRERDKRMKESVKKTNNFIELNLYR